MVNDCLEHYVRRNEVNILKHVDEVVNSLERKEVEKEEVPVVQVIFEGNKVLVEENSVDNIVLEEPV